MIHYLPRMTVVAVSCLLLLNLSGCRLQPRYPSQIHQVIGTSYNPDANLVTPKRAGLAATETSATISAVGESQAVDSTLDTTQAPLIAKQQARQEARRSLARRIESIPIEPGRTIGDAIREDTAKREQLERLVQAARQDGIVRSGESGRYTATMSVEMQPIAELFLASAQSLSPTAATGPVLSDQARRWAEAEAIDRARENAVDFIKNLRTTTGESVGQLMLVDDEFNEAIRAKVKRLEPTNVTYSDDGTCEAAIDLDLSEIQRILAEYRAPRRRAAGPMDYMSRTEGDFGRE